MDETTKLDLQPAQTVSGSDVKLTCQLLRLDESQAHENEHNEMHDANSDRIKSSNNFQSISLLHFFFSFFRLIAQKFSFSSNFLVIFSHFAVDFYVCYFFFSCFLI
jgi:hypothetical protein